MCWPNLSVLKMGLCTALELPDSFDALAFAEGSWALENRSVVARGIAENAEVRKETKFENSVAYVSVIGRLFRKKSWESLSLRVCGLRCPARNWRNNSRPSLSHGHQILYALISSSKTFWHICLTTQAWHPELFKSPRLFKTMSCKNRSVFLLLETRKIRLTCAHSIPCQTKCCVLHLDHTIIRA